VAAAAAGALVGSELARRAFERIPPLRPAVVESRRRPSAVPGPRPR
jgi:hypothetical protein